MTRLNPKLEKAVFDDLAEEDFKAGEKKRKIKVTRRKKQVREKVAQGDLDFDSMSREEILELLDILNDDVDAESEIEECRLYLYKPSHEVALQFHLCTTIIQLVGGGNRSGKTTTSIVDSLIALTGIVPKALKGIYPKAKLFHPQFHRVVSTDFPNGIEKVILPMFLGPKAWFPQSMIAGWDSKNRTMYIRNINGTISSVEFMSYDQDVEKFQGTSRHRVLYDEEPPEAIRKECKMRVIDVDGVEIFSMTPTKGMSWTYDELYEKRGREVAYDEETELEEGCRSDPSILVGAPDSDLLVPDGDIDITFFSFFSTHNPNINQERVSKEAGKMSKEERSMRMFGQYISFTGKVFGRYKEPIHLVKEVFDIPEDWPRYMALDPHPRTPCAVLWVAVDSMGRKWVYDELWTQESCTTESLVRQMLEKEFYQYGEDRQIDLDGNRLVFNQDIIPLKNVNGMWMLTGPLPFKRPFVVKRFIDPSAEIQNPSTGTTLTNDLLRMGIGHFFLGSKDLTRGIMRVNSAFENNEVFIFPHLIRTRYEFKRYVWDDYSQKSEQRNAKQKPKDKDDHMMENLRRIIVEEPMYVARESYDEDLGNWRQY